MVGEKLERDDGQDRADVIGRFRKRDDVVGDLCEAVGAVAGGEAMTGPLRALTCSMLFRFFEKTESSGAMKTEGRSGRIERNDAVLELGARMAFGEKVGDLLHLERAFERDREIELPAEKQHAVRIRVFLAIALI